MKTHQYNITTTWTGNTGSGTSKYNTYTRDHSVFSEGKLHDISGSSDPHFLGNTKRYNPEELFLASLSSCHMLWYLHLCATNKIVVTSYSNKAQGLMEEFENGSGRFKEVTLFPHVSVQTSEMIEPAKHLHKEANKMCFIANSCNFKIGHKPEIMVE
ncbi:MAG: OsmC family protein [Leeuwenhoekiella sp.]